MPALGEFDIEAPNELKAVRDGDILKCEKETFSAVLSRSEINDLIKVLRRARDQAYGRDE